MIRLMSLVCFCFFISASVFSSEFQGQSVKNAADIYRKAFELYQKEGLEEIDINSGASIEDLENYVHRCQPSIDLIYQAVEIEKCDWGILNNYEGLFEYCDILMLMRKLFLLAIQDVQLKTEKSMFKTALLRSNKLFQMIHHIGNSNFLGHLASIVPAYRLIDCTKNILGHMPADGAALQWLEAELKKENDRFRSFTEALEGEREYLIQVLLRNTQKGSLWLYFGVDPNSMPEVTEEYIQKSIEYNNNFIKQISKASELPYERAFNKIKEVQQSVIDETHIIWKDAEKKILDPNNVQKCYSVLTSLSCGALPRFYSLHIQVKTELNALISGVKVYQYYAETGRLPQTLPANCPADLFSDKPFIYEAKENSFVLRCQRADNLRDKTYEYEFKLAEKQSEGEAP